eukprot:766853-Hanusia_phi.AAC.1
MFLSGSRSPKGLHEVRLGCKLLHEKAAAANDPESHTYVQYIKPSTDVFSILSSTDCVSVLWQCHGASSLVVTSESVTARAAPGPLSLRSEGDVSRKLNLFKLNLFYSEFTVSYHSIQGAGRPGPAVRVPGPGAPE